MNWTAIFGSASGILGTITVIDHVLAASTRYLPNSAWQLTKALITRTPLRAAQGDTNMSFLDDMEKFVGRMKTVAKEGLEAVDQVALFVEKAAPLAAAIAPLTGSSAPAVAAGANAAAQGAAIADQVIQAAEAASQGSQELAPAPAAA